MEITEENLEFPCDIKDNLKKFVNTSRINIKFIDGKKLLFNKTNLAIEDPCRIIFSNDINYLEAMLYSNDKSFYISDFNDSFSLKKLVDFVNKYL